MKCIKTATAVFLSLSLCLGHCDASVLQPPSEKVTCALANSLDRLSEAVRRVAEPDTQRRIGRQVSKLLHANLFS